MLVLSHVSERRIQIGIKRISRNIPNKRALFSSIIFPISSRYSIVYTFHEFFEWNSVKTWRSFPAFFSKKVRKCDLRRWILVDNSIIPPVTRTNGQSKSGLWQIGNGRRGHKAYSPLLNNRLYSVYSPEDPKDPPRRK